MLYNQPEKKITISMREKLVALTYLKSQINTKLLRFPLIRKRLTIIVLHARNLEQLFCTVEREMVDYG